jgi:hypothetical protein
MKKLVFAIALFLVVPVMRAQQAETSSNARQSESQPAQQAPPQAAVQNPNAEDNLPPELRPGHPLDPADVDILTGKRDREIEAARRASVPAIAGAYGAYGTYGDYYWMTGRLGRQWDIPMLPLARIGNPFFFSMLQPRGFGRGRFRGGR